MEKNGFELRKETKKSSINQGIKTNKKHIDTFFPLKKINRVKVHKLMNLKLPKSQKRGLTTFSTKKAIISETQNATYDCFSPPATHIVSELPAQKKKLASKRIFCWSYGP